MAVGALRLFRASLVTATVVVLAAGAHVLGGGTLPAPEIAVALVLLVLAVVMWVAGRQLSLAKIAAVLGGGQVLLHEAFNLLSGGTGCENGLPGNIPHHASPTGMSCLSPALSEAPSPLTHAGAGIAMLLAHLLAVAVTALVLGKAEAALWQLVAWLRPLTHFLRPVTIHRCGPPRSGFDFCLVASPWRNLRADGIRGPPGPGVPLARPV